MVAARPGLGRLRSMSSAPRPVDESVLHDLRVRLRGYRRVPLVEDVGWDRGTDADYLAELVDYWAQTYGWRKHEERILDRPWVRTDTGGTPLRSIHQAAGADAPTVVLLHGWPDSLLRFERVLPLLTDVNVVVPCLPGYPYADPGGGVNGRARSRALCHSTSPPQSLQRRSFSTIQVGLPARRPSDLGHRLLGHRDHRFVVPALRRARRASREPGRGADGCDDLPEGPGAGAPEFGARIFDIREWDEEPSGGHFGAWERPEAYVAGLRKAAALA